MEVLSPEEILQTLDDRGAVDNMPFMPEMLRHAGRRFQVSASAHKACDTIDTYRNRRIDDAVHLGVRCDGSAHGGCQASCLLYWKTAWLRPVDGPVPTPPSTTAPVTAVNTAVVDRAARAASPKATDRRVKYSCQATRLVEASIPMRQRDLRQYWRDWASGNVDLWTMFRYMPLALYNTIVWRTGRCRVIPSFEGLAGSTTPTEALGLQPGELVEVKPMDEIAATLDAHGRNRGMYFDVEMMPFCGGRYRVHKRVDKLIDEKTGYMMNMKTPGVILENVVCKGCYHPERLFCPRDIHPYWREIWLRRV
ncbi:hypothetical protein ACFYVR_13250 [Rhodococcus sp. NPDC003318]|uniref:hypothetical protein n=1 Tax=Rhodococcus sp. NPDC003318 TaxID=3364503 RepID=UPI0036A754E3